MHTRITTAPRYPFKRAHALPHGGARLPVGAMDSFVVPRSMGGEWVEPEGCLRVRLTL